MSQICTGLAHLGLVSQWHFVTLTILADFLKVKPPLSNLPEQHKREQEVIRRFVLMHLPGKITYREIDEMIATVDKNEDWKISYSEFRVSFCCLRAETMYKRIIRTVLFAAYCFHICDHNRYQNDCTHWGYSDMENVKYFTQVNLPKYLPDKKAQKLVQVQGCARYTL